MVWINILVCILGLCFIWALWQKVCLDSCRDRLFDLREDVRDHFVNSVGLGHPLYKEIRDAINAIIRFTEEFDILTIFFIFKNMRTSIAQTSLSKISTCKGEQFSEVIKKVQATSVSALGMYLIDATFVLFIPYRFLLLFFFLIAPFRSTIERYRKARNCVLNMAKIRSLEVQPLKI